MGLDNDVEATSDNSPTRTIGPVSLDAATFSSSCATLSVWPECANTNIGSTPAGDKTISVHFLPVSVPICANSIQEEGEQEQTNIYTRHNEAGRRASLEPEALLSPPLPPGCARTRIAFGPTGKNYCAVLFIHPFGRHLVVLVLASLEPLQGHVTSSRVTIVPV